MLGCIKIFNFLYLNYKYSKSNLRERSQNGHFWFTAQSFLIDTYPWDCEYLGSHQYVYLVSPCGIIVRSTTTTHGALSKLRWWPLIKPWVQVPFKNDLGYYERKKFYSIEPWYHWKIELKLILRCYFLWYQRKPKKHSRPCHWLDTQGSHWNFNKKNNFFSSALKLDSHIAEKHNISIISAINLYIKCPFFLHGKEKIVINSTFFGFSKTKNASRIGKAA